ncbi:MAG: BON domain-containing protein [Candidatus Eremiobacteraeota bacterium]|nr:BON domain-containing protein [Candidatus Eremiobacteraeota bacterium]MBV8366018.1 BON domain-containing protein [Candidatus Eremiobacteraeota bacterium]
MQFHRSTLAARLCAGLAAGALIALSACSKSDQEQTQRALEQAGGDAWICTQVRTAATTLDPATVSLVKIECHSGTVTMDGQVRSAQEREQLVAAARNVQGVKSVVTHVRVNPKAPTGNEIADDVALEAKVHVAIAGQTGVNALKINVSSHKGVVTLDGTVPSPAIKTVALEAARGVNGVKRVVDKLAVQR